MSTFQFFDKFCYIISVRNLKISTDNSLYFMVYKDTFHVSAIIYDQLQFFFHLIVAVDNFKHTADFFLSQKNILLLSLPLILHQPFQHDSIANLSFISQ